MHTIELHGPVGGERFNVRLLQDLPSGPLKIIISSPGGCVVTGLAIYRLLLDHPGEVTTEINQAGSAAVLPALAGDRRSIHGSGYFFVHGCWGTVVGRECDMREAAARFHEQNKLYDSVIHERTGLSLRRVRALTRNETTISPADAIRLGFAHDIIGPPQQVERSTSIEGTALAALRHEERTLEPKTQELCNEARPLALLDPRSGPVLNRPPPKTPPYMAVNALDRFCENERREAGIRSGLATRLRRVIDRGGSIAWPIRVTWTCSTCGETNYGLPSKNRLATPCAECGATSIEGNKL